MINNLNILLSSINSLVLLYFLHSSAKLVIGSLKLTFSKSFLNIFFIFIFISFLSLIFQIILVFDYKFFFKQKENIKILSLIIIYLNFIYCIPNICQNIKKITNFSFNKIWITTFLILVFVCSLGIVNDADSLIYHSKISKVVLAGFPVNYFYDNPHYLLIGTYEIFNIFPEILNISNFNALLNFYVLLFFIKFIYEKFSEKNYNLDLFLLLLISTPVITILITPQKSFLFPLLIQFLTFIYILYNESFSKKEYSIIITALVFTITFKLNFILSAILIFIILLYKNKNFIHLIFIFKICLIIFLFFLLPHFVFKTFYFDSPFPPFLNQFLDFGTSENLYHSFSNELKDWKKNSIPFPLGLFINYFNGSFSSVHNSLGIGILSFIFIKKINTNNFKIIVFFLIGIISLNFLFVQQTPRFYFLPYLISLLIIFEAKIKNQSFLKKIIFIQYIFTLLSMLILAPVSISTSFLDNKMNNYKKEFIFRYEAFQKINEIVGEDQFIIVDVPNYYSKNFEISTMILEYISNEQELKNYKNYLNQNDVSYFFSVNNPIEKNIYINRNGIKFDNFFSKCFEEFIEKFSFEAANRKKILFNFNKKVTYYVYKKTKGCKFD